MKTAVIHVDGRYVYTVEVSDVETNISSIPIPLYSFQVLMKDVKTIPHLLKDIGVEYWDIYCPCERVFPNSLKAARDALLPLQGNLAMVQERFW